MSCSVRRLKVWIKPEVLDRLLAGIGVAIDDYGGSFVMNFETVLITATRLG